MIRLRHTVLATVVAVMVGCGGSVGPGVAAFEAGALDEAIGLWTEAAGEGRKSGTLHFDLANAWYRKGDLPRALAHYRAAQQVRPRDGNVHHNLALARADLLAEGAVPEPAAGPRAWMAAVTPGELALLGLLLTAVGSGLALRWRRDRKAGERGLGYPALAAWMAGVLVTGVAAEGAVAGRSHPVVVVVDAPAPVRDMAREDAAERFTLPPGSELRVERDLGPFLLVEDGRGRRGWVTRAGVWVP